MGDSINTKDIVDMSCEMYFRLTPEDENIQNHHVADAEEAVIVERYDEASEAAPRHQRKAPIRLGVLTGEWWNLFETNETTTNLTSGTGNSRRNEFFDRKQNVGQS